MLFCCSEYRTQPKNGMKTVKKSKASVRKRKVLQKKRTFAKEVDSQGTRIVKENRMRKATELQRERRMP